MRTLFLLAALAFPASAQIRVETMPVLPLGAAAPVALAPAARLALAAPSLLAAPSAAQPQGGPILAAPGRALESAPSAAGDEAAISASPEELDFAARATERLAARADDLAVERGLRIRAMRGAEFLALVDEARVRADREEAAPTPAAAAAAKEVHDSLMRVLRALIPAERPLTDSLARALSVWQVMGQEMTAAAKLGTLAAISGDARLFASQVEQSAQDSAGRERSTSQTTPAEMK
jgi:hypothetical protein